MSRFPFTQIPTGFAVDTANGPMIVCGRSWTKEAGERSDFDPVATPADHSVSLSQDGRGWWSEWHQGPESGREVYVERWEPSGLAFHGFVDAESRKIIQTG